MPKAVPRAVPGTLPRAVPLPATDRFFPSRNNSIALMTKAPGHGARNSFARACKPLAPPPEIWHCAPPPDRTGLLSLLAGGKRPGLAGFPRRARGTPSDRAERIRRLNAGGSVCYNRSRDPPAHFPAYDCGMRGRRPCRCEAPKRIAGGKSREGTRTAGTGGPKGRVRFTGQRQGERPFDGRAGLLDRERARPERRRTVPAQDERGQT